MKFEISNLKLYYESRVTGHEPRLMAVLVVIFVISQACFSATGIRTKTRTQNPKPGTQDAKTSAVEPVKNAPVSSAAKTTDKPAAKTADKPVAGDTETIVERFRRQQAAGQAQSKDEVPPLVKEATAFSRYLNPPPPPPVAAAGSGPRGIPEVVKPAEIVKFQLLATSVHRTNPELSLALIDLPAEGFKWVRPSSKVGHLVIKEIKDGVLVIQDSQRTFEVQIEKGQEEVSLIKGKGISQARGAEESFVSTSVPAGLTTPDSRLQTPDAKLKTQDAATVQGGEPAEETIKAEQDAFVQKFLSEIGTITADGNESDEAIAEQFKKLDEMMAKNADQNRTQISAKEAQGLNQLGKVLNQPAEPNHSATLKADNSATKTTDKPKQPVTPRRPPARPGPRKP